MKPSADIRDQTHNPFAGSETPSPLGYWTNFPFLFVDWNKVCIAQISECVMFGAVDVCFLCNKNNTETTSESESEYMHNIFNEDESCVKITI